MVYTKIKTRYFEINMSKLLNRLAALSKTNRNHFNRKDPSLQEALEFLSNNESAFRSLKGSRRQEDDEFETFIEPLLNAEAKAGSPGWRVVIDMPVNEQGIYNKDPVIQICTGGPHYERYVMKFTSTGVEIKLDTTCVEANPDLSQIYSEPNIRTHDSKSLEEVKDFCDDAMIHRIAILGAARVFPHPKDESELTRKEKIAQQYNTRVQQEVNQVLDVMGEKEAEFLLVNGGWSGKKEGSMGIPLISYYMGKIHDTEINHGLPPVTVMPEIGNYDRVETHVANSAHPHINLAIPDYFEVEGTWGDDSKYLIGISTGAIVFEDYGAWTEIEIANAVTQNKPIAIIANPQNFEEGEKYYGRMQAGEEFIEVKLPLPGNTEKTYRVYRDARAATEWIHASTEKKFLKQNTKKLEVVGEEITLKPRNIEQTSWYKRRLYDQTHRNKVQDDDQKYDSNIKPNKPPSFS